MSQLSLEVDVARSPSRPSWPLPPAAGGRHVGQSRTEHVGCPFSKSLPLSVGQAEAGPMWPGSPPAVRLCGVLHRGFCGGSPGRWALGKATGWPKRGPYIPRGRCPCTKEHDNFRYNKCDEEKYIFFPLLLSLSF